MNVLDQGVVDESLVIPAARLLDERAEMVEHGVVQTD
jgi:hypothetical protein